MANEQLFGNGNRTSKLEKAFAQLKAFLGGKNLRFLV
jgi:hypothetical protein